MANEASRSTQAAKRKAGGGFSLIELLVVLAVIAILCALLLTSLAKARQISQDTVCLANHRQIGIAWNLYLNDFDNFPVKQGQLGHINYDWGGVHFYGRDENGDPVYVNKYQGERPVNPYFGAATTHEAEFRVFRCPRDIGMVRAGTGEPIYVWEIWENASWSDEAITRSMYASRGTSYGANWMMYRKIGEAGMIFGSGGPGKPPPEYRDHYGPSDVRVAPSLFPLIIDGGALHAGWWPETSRRAINMPVGWWHGFNIGYMTFLDGSARGEEMGAPVTPGYSMFLDPGKHNY